jgi:hypothetical protein
MASTGDTFPTSGTSVNNSGGNDWTSPGNITADDTSYATVNVSGVTNYLVAKAFGFAVPSDAVIGGVTVKIMCREASGGSDTQSLQLQNASGNLFGSAKAGADPGNSFVLITYGDSTDTWGASLTPSIVNDADFGVRFWDDSGSVKDWYVDYITMSVTYTTDKSVGLTGVSASTSVGTSGEVTAGILTGSSATGSAGTPVAGATLALSGNTGTSGVGSVTPYAAFGAVSDVGNVSAEIPSALAGVAGSSSVGEVYVDYGTVVGNRGLSAVESPGVGLEVALSGVQATSAVGNSMYSLAGSQRWHAFAVMG